MATHSAAAVGYLAISFVVYSLASLFRYVRSAKATGLPYAVVPFLETETISQILTPTLRKICTNHLDEGKGWPRWCRFMIRDWCWEDKRRAHEEYGDVFLVVSPQGIVCYCADAAMAFDVVNRRSDFTKPRDKFKLLEPYGPNVVTAEGSTYRFHVRMVAPSFGDNTGVNELVWQETSRQTRLLMGIWTKATPERLDRGINALTLAVISLAGFGKRLDSVEEQEQDIPAGYKISFLSALRSTTRNILPILLLPPWFLDIANAQASLAKRQLDKYLRSMIHSERTTKGADFEADLGSQSNLLHTVVHASHDEEGKNLSTRAAKERKQGFTEDEVMGNLFIYILAGYETTANSIQYGLLVLAANPDIQSKLIAEIDRVYEEAAAEGRHTLKYNKDFEKLEYSFGFMYGTFRLYPGVLLITRVCNTEQTIHVYGDKTNNSQAVVLPAGCKVCLSSPGVHYHPRYWEDAGELKPERWFTDKFSHQGGATADQGGKHVVAADRARHMRGTLLTFSDGARKCLGRKFAQAEYMAFFATLLRQFRVKFADGVDMKKVKSRLDNHCAGKIVSLTPLSGFPLELRRRIPA